MSESQKLYAAFIVSTKPINLGNLPQDHSVTHLVNEDLDLRPERGPNGFGIYNKSAPQHCGGYEHINAFGKSVPLAILAWFGKLCSYDRYTSVENKRRGE
jgi:hypothetical protein